MTHAFVELLPPPLRTHRPLRKLQSAHNLGSKAALQLQSLSQPSLIAQQRLTQRNISPTRRDASSSSAMNLNRSPQRGRSNSDATSQHHLNALAATKRSMMGINPRYVNLSLNQLIKDGPTDGDGVEALGMARRKVLSEGIKSDSDGMVKLLSS